MDEHNRSMKRVLDKLGELIYLLIMKIVRSVELDQSFWDIK